MICHHCIRGALRNWPWLQWLYDCIPSNVWADVIVGPCGSPVMFQRLSFLSICLKYLKPSCWVRLEGRSRNILSVLGLFRVTGEAVIYIQRGEAVTCCLSSKAGFNPLSRFPVSRFKRVKVLSAYNRMSIQVPVRFVNSVRKLWYTGTLRPKIPKECLWNSIIIYRCNSKGIKQESTKNQAQSCSWFWVHFQ